KKENYYLKHSMYIPKIYDLEFDGISYRLNNYYKSTRDKWEKIDVKFIQKGANFDLYNILLDEKEDIVYFNNL
ncbi:MAG: type I-B CRISPR-associated protein Cas5, partial [Clostridiales bacterium]|nr:type I-B CRISPR-associated protein Cas5 [Clostridiales bacterium]